MLGATLVAAGLALVAWAAATLWRAGTPVRHRGQPRVLVDEGPYRRSRHPMVLGTALALLGLGIATASLLLLAVAALYAWTMARWAVPAEEARLARTFGGWWTDYTAVTRRWL